MADSAAQNKIYLDAVITTQSCTEKYFTFEISLELRLCVHFEELSPHNLSRSEMVCTWDFFFFLNVDKDRVSLISIETKFHN